MTIQSGDDTRQPPPGRRRASHSMEAVVTEAVALLDESGEKALTFRSLAARLGGGVASIYWYVSSKDELLDRAVDHVMADVLKQTEGFAGQSDPIDDLRAIAWALFDAVVPRPWVGSYLMRNTGAQPNSLALYERIGQEVMRLKLPPKETFYAASAIVGYVIGTATDLGQELPPELLDGTVTPAEYLKRAADEWRSLDPQRYPFVHYIVDEFDGHDDTEQFRGGLDLLLDGLALKAGDAPSAPAT